MPSSGRPRCPRGAGEGARRGGFLAVPSRRGAGGAVPAPAARPLGDLGGAVGPPEVVDGPGACILLQGRKLSSAQRRFRKGRAGMPGAGNEREGSCRGSGDYSAESTKIPCCWKDLGLPANASAVKPSPAARHRDAPAPAGREQRELHEARRWEHPAGDPGTPKLPRGKAPKGDEGRGRPNAACPRCLPSGTWKSREGTQRAGARRG